MSRETSSGIVFLVTRDEGRRIPMSLGRAIKGAFGAILAAVVLGPLIAVALGAIFDRGPNGELRSTPFHIVLVAWDPFARECLRNSLFIALSATVGSLLLGTGLAALIARKRFWGRPIPIELIAFGAGVPPLFAGLGWRHGLDRLYGGTWNERQSIVFIVLTLMYIMIGMRGVFAAAVDGFESAEPGAIDAARLAGAGRWTIVRLLLWPVARPQAARACAGVFTLAMFDPAGPLILGARRTLGFQIVDFVARGDSSNRAAAFAVCGGTILAMGIVVLGRWGGDPRPIRNRRRFPMSGGMGVWVASAFLGGIAAIESLPLLGLIDAARVGGFFKTAASVLRDDEVREAIVNTLAWSAAAATIAVVSALAARGSSWSRTVEKGRRTIPALGIALGFFLIPGLLEGAAASRGLSSGWAKGMSRAAILLDPVAPWALIAALAALVSPVAVAGVARGTRRKNNALRDAALTMGAGRFRAWRLAAGPFRRLPAIRAWAACFALAATEVTTGLLLAPTSLTRPLGPTVARLAFESGRLSEAALLAIAGAIIARLAVD